MFYYNSVIIEMLRWLFMYRMDVEKILASLFVIVVLMSLLFSVSPANGASCLVLFSFDFTSSKAANPNRFDFTIADIE